LDNDALEYGARLWGNLLGLGLASAFLEQENRTKQTLDGGAEAIVAKARDYRVAYELIEATSKRSMENISDVHRKILTAVHELQSSYAHGGWSMNKIARKAGVSTATVHRHKTFLTKSLGYLAEDQEDGDLRLALGVDPSWWEKGEAMRGFPTPGTVESWEGDTHAFSSEKQRNSETVKPNPDTYAEKPISQGRNGSETSETAQPLKNKLPGVVNVKDREKHEYVYVGRSKKYGGPHYFHNPFEIGKDGTREEVLEKYKPRLAKLLATEEGRAELEKLRAEVEAGRYLGCHCAGKDGTPGVLAADDPLHCHAQLILAAMGILDEKVSKNGKVIASEEEVFDLVRSEPLLDNEEEL
jgi:hypothetical protein